MKKWSVISLLIGGAVILGATVLREPVANAAQSVGATIVGPLDAQGNVSVHEQGTAVVRDADSPALHRFQATGEINIFGANLFAGASVAQVPAGKRLVIEYVSAEAKTPTDQRIAEFDLQIGQQGDPHLIPHFFPIQFEGTIPGTDQTQAQDMSVAGEATRLYADPGTTVEAFAERTAVGGAASIAVSISGYLIDA